MRCRYSIGMSRRDRRGSGGGCKRKLDVTWLVLMRGGDVGRYREGVVVVVVEEGG